MKTSTSQVGGKSNGKAKQKQQRAIPCACCEEAAATQHLSQIVGNKMRKLDLCDGCARMAGSMFGAKAQEVVAEAGMPAAPSGRYAEMLREVLSPERFAELEQGAIRKDWTLEQYLSDAIDRAAMADKFAREAGCHGCVFVPLSNDEVQAILHRHDPRRGQRIDQILRAWVLERMQGKGPEVAA